MNTVYFGPWVGEFGWELTYWQGYIRRLRQTTYKDYKCIVSSSPDKYPLYEFADEFWPLPQWWLDLKQTREEYHIYKGSPHLQKLRQEILTKLPGNATIVYPETIYKWKHPGAKYNYQKCRIPNEEQTFVKLGNHQPIKNTIPKNIVILARGRKFATPKNWAESKWSLLIKLLKHDWHCDITIAGVPGDCLLSNKPGFTDITNTGDKRLEVTIKALETADFAVSSISGGSVLLNFTCCPHVCFGIPIYKDRILKLDNPFNTKCHYISNDRWDPPVFNVYAECKKLWNVISVKNQQ